MLSHFGMLGKLKQNKNGNEAGEDTYAGALHALRAGSPAFFHFRLNSLNIRNWLNIRLNIRLKLQSALCLTAFASSF